MKKQTITEFSNDVKQILIRKNVLLGVRKYRERRGSVYIILGLKTIPSGNSVGRQTKSHQHRVSPPIPSVTALTSDLAAFRYFVCNRLTYLSCHVNLFQSIINIQKRLCSSGVLNMIPVNLDRGFPAFIPSPNMPLDQVMSACCISLRWKHQRLP